MPKHKKMPLLVEKNQAHGLQPVGLMTFFPIFSAVSATFVSPW
jgi:hypothetical protein